MMMEGSLFLLISSVLGRGCGAQIMMMKDFLFLLISNILGRGPSNDDEGSLFLLISNVLGRGCGAGRGPNNDNERFFVSVDFKFFRKGAQ